MSITLPNKRKRVILNDLESHSPRFYADIARITPPSIFEKMPFKHLSGKYGTPDRGEEFIVPEIDSNFEGESYTAREPRIYQTEEGVYLFPAGTRAELLPSMSGPVVCYRFIVNGIRRRAFTCLSTFPEGDDL